MLARSGARTRVFWRPLTARHHPLHTPVTGAHARVHVHTCR